MWQALCDKPNVAQIGTWPIVTTALKQFTWNVLQRWKLSGYRSCPWEKKTEATHAAATSQHCTAWTLTTIWTSHNVWMSEFLYESQMLSQLSEPYFKAYHRLVEKGKDARNNNDSSFSQDLVVCLRAWLSRKKVWTFRGKPLLFLFSSNCPFSPVTH